MRDFQKDKIIKSRFSTNEKIPDNINNIFDKFIYNNITTKFEPKIIKFSKTKKVLSAVASTTAVVLAGGTIYAAITGNSLISLFNINEEKYNEDLVSVNEQITNQDIVVELTQYAVDHNAVIVNYKISSKKELNFKKNTDNLVIKSNINNNNIELNVDNQNFLSDNGSYIVSTLYSIEQFGTTMDKFSLNIEISKIADIDGIWNFNLEIDKSKIEENREYSFIDSENLNDENRMPLKTQYMPISYSVKNLSISDFSSVIDLQMFYNQNGVEQQNRIEPKKDLSLLSDETKDERWQEVEKFVFVVEDDNENILISKNYDYTRKVAIDEVKLRFPNVEKDIKKLNLKIYLVNTDNENELVGNFEFDLEDLGVLSNKDVLNQEGTLDNGNISYKVASNWKVYDEDKQNNRIEMSKLDSYGNGVTISFAKIDKSDYSDFGISDEYSLEEIATKNKTINYDFKTAEDKRIINKGEEQIGDYKGYQITYSLKFSSNNIVDKSEKWDSKTKDFYFKVNNELYLASIYGDSEVTVDSYLYLFEDFVEAINIKK